MPSFPTLSVAIVMLLVGWPSEPAVRADSAGDAGQGRTYFQQNCALCHAAALGPDGAQVMQQGPGLVGVVGRAAASLPGFNYSDALKKSGMKWDDATLDKFLTSPTTVVPGTTMPIAVANANDRQNVIAYLATLKASATAGPGEKKAASSTTEPQGEAGDWNHASPGVAHHIIAASLPEPFATRSAGNGPSLVERPEGATLSVPPGFTVRPFASGLQNPRAMRVAPNSDVFVAETGASRITVIRTKDGADKPALQQVYASGLDHPFGMAFYPPGKNPRYIYIANNNSIVRIAYHNGDLQASGQPEVIVPKLTDSHGGHSTRDVAFSPDGERMFISVGSGSNVADGMSKKSVADAQAWEAEHGFGSSWDGETNRADILVTDPEGKTGLHTFASGIRNGVGIAVNPQTGDLWTSVNERDGLGDDLVPDYITRVKEGGYYGWPWYYMGNHEDPRLRGDRPDLAGKAIVPDVLLQAHSASLELCFYPMGQKGVAAFPAEYDGNAFAAEHGSWNRTTRTGYKVIRVRIKNGVPTGEYDDFLTGFVVDNRTVWGRPVGVAVAHDGALLVSEDGHDSIWRIAYSTGK